jgi:hypothetical protein
VTSLPDVTIIDVAERALRAFGGDLTRPQDALLLTMWRYRADLNPADTSAVLHRFPNGEPR